MVNRSSLVTDRDRAKEEDKPDKADHTLAYLIFFVSLLALICLTGLSVYNGHINIKTTTDSFSTVQLVGMILGSTFVTILGLSGVENETTKSAINLLYTMIAATLIDGFVL